MKGNPGRRGRQDTAATGAGAGFGGRDHLMSLRFLVRLNEAAAAAAPVDRTFQGCLTRAVKLGGDRSVILYFKFQLTEHRFSG